MGHVLGGVLAAVAAASACAGERDERGSTADSVAPAPAQAPGPHVAYADTGPVIRLPPNMRRVLDDYAPEFSPWRRDAYARDVLAHFAADSAAPLFGAVGDFNGDGVPDVALQGYTRQHELFFVLLSAEDTVRVIELRRRDLYFAPRGLERDRYLRTVTEGEPLDVSRELSERPPALRHDAIMEIVEGRAAVLYYWTGERFDTYVVGD